jgi:hypothetical protein
VKTIGVLLVVSWFVVGLAQAAEMTVAEWEKQNAEATAMFGELSAQVAAGEARPIKCAMPILNSLLENQPKGATSKVLYVGREDTMSFTYPSQHFLLHYTNTGANRVYLFDQQDSAAGVPNYIFAAAKILDSVWLHTVNVLGFRAPLSDAYYMGGGDGRLDVYFIDFPAYGATVRDSIQATLPLTATAYLFLENDYQGFPGYETNRLNALRVAAAHEFFHAVQFNIDLQELEGSGPNQNPAWMEMSATFMEEEHYDNINDYYFYLPYFYDFPQWSLRTGTTQISPAINNLKNLHMYASVVFPIFLAENFGSTIMKQIWDGCGAQAGPNWWLATDAAIRNATSDNRNLRDVYAEFALWNLFTRHRARPGSYFPEAINYDSVNLAARVDSVPQLISVVDSLKPDNLGANYIVLSNLSEAPTGLAITFAPDSTRPWGFWVVGLYSNPAQEPYVDSVIYDSTGSLILIPEAAQFSRIVLIPAVLGGSALQNDYTLSITPLGEGVARPNGGELLIAGSQYDITWYLDTAVATVRIDLSIDNGQTWEQIVVTPNTRLYSWTVPQVSSDSCLIRVADTSATGPSDVSDNVFSIHVASGDMVSEPFPNPAWVQNHPYVTFRAVYDPSAGGQEMTVTITTIAGEKVKELSESSTSGSIEIKWDYKNESGETVAAGPYLAVIKLDGDTVVKKFVVLR